MFKTAKEAFQYLVQQYKQNTGKFPIGEEVNRLMQQAENMLGSPLTLNQEVTPQFPKAGIEALPLADKAKREEAMRKKMEAQNVQGIMGRKGEQTEVDVQKGRPELVDKNFGDVVYVDKGLMKERMNEAYDKFEYAESAVANGKLDEARAILRYEIEDNLKFPKNVREAAADARYMIRRGEGIDKTGYETEAEALEELSNKIELGRMETNNLPDFTDPYEGQSQLIEYVDTFAEAGEDFGTPNSKIINPDDVEFAEGGRVGYASGGVIKALQAMYKGADFGYFADLLNEAKKAGIPINTLRDFFNFEKQIQDAGGKIYESRKSFPGVEGEKSGLPVDVKQTPVKKGEVLEDGTPDYEYYEEILNDSENDFVTGTETIEELEAMVKERNDEMAYMYSQYKMGKLDPKPGEKSRSRMTYLQDKQKEAEMTDDFRLFTPNDRDELQTLESEFEYTDLREKLDSTRKMTDEDLARLKELDDSGYEDFMNEMNRTRKAKGGLAYLMGL